MQFQLDKSKMICNKEKKEKEVSAKKTERKGRKKNHDPFQELFPSETVVLCFHFF